ncbi:hypothetical protein [Luteimonas saliphila]|uniref:hypothetical protein n=1 Tax=Luteimonas saliphila TaxID=2804919 RepID=UPI00192D6522|nr:hypothetical protein [Luteimonas saliphila]
MNHRSRIATAVAAALMLPFAFAAQAQDFAEPARFELRLSAFNPEANIAFRGDGIATDGERTEELEAAGDIGVDGRWRPRGEFAFNMTPRQSLRVNYYDYRREESWRFDGEWVDPGGIFDEVALPGDPVEVPSVDLDGRLSFELASVNYDFAVVDTPRFEWGLGLGITHASLEARATGRSTGTDALAPEWERVSWKRDGTSPNLHTRLAWTPAPRWRVEVQGQYLDTRWGDFIDERGHFERGGLLVEYLVTERVALHAGYDWFRLKLSDDYRGSFDPPPESGVGTVDVSGRVTGQFKVHGPMAGVTFRF